MTCNSAIASVQGEGETVISPGPRCSRTLLLLHLGYHCMSMARYRKGVGRWRQRKQSLTARCGRRRASVSQRIAHQPTQTPIPGQNAQFMTVPKIPMPSPFYTNARAVLQRITCSLLFCIWMTKCQPIGFFPSEPAGSLGRSTNSPSTLFCFSPVSEVSSTIRQSLSEFLVGSPKQVMSV